ncbi:MAG TPA: beta-ketoacyl synthase N-terminal-like domain-containing protein, partial [Ramlibacter sp.]
MELTGALERDFGELSKTLFFEYQTLAELVDHFVGAHGGKLAAMFGGAASPAATPAAALPVTASPSAMPAPTAPLSTPMPARTEPADTGAMAIAIIGMSGRYPMAEDLEAFWRNLRDGRDCITEVPADRWDWRAFYSADRSVPQRHYCKWGGFVADIDKFDPLFFNISPGAAEYMDPQERLFLEHAWAALEDAGVRREDLQRPGPGAFGPQDLPAQVGVYAGVMYGEYQLLAREAAQRGTALPVANFYASIANRVSYALNLHGPSLAVDTMCSSSLTAIHLACQDLQLGRTTVALAGGVNLNLHPNKYDVLSTGQFISSNGRCESFGAGGDGYVPSEGVGVLVLKRLVDAVRDGDPIHGVIRGSALNHGGKTNGYSVPNPHAQQMVIARALSEAGVDARALGYIEAHGTGTRLGDPIEVAGLSKALQERAPGHTCWIGSCKSNIGHGEAAAGIAGVHKVLLQLREGQIAPSLHSQTLNPNIDFTGPMRVNRELRPWPRPVIDGQVGRRVAGISSFGAGGSNAHLLIEEHVPAPRAPLPAAAVDAPQLLVLSARAPAQLQQAAARLRAVAQARQGHADAAEWLRDAAWTLQVGREAMPHRLAFVVRNVDELVLRLDAHAAGSSEHLHMGRATSGAAAAPDDASLDALAAAWVRGAPVDWAALQRDAAWTPRRIALPTYPFARDRYWIDVAIPGSLPTPQVEAAPIEVREGHDVLAWQPTWRVRPLAALGAGSDAVRQVVWLAPSTPPAGVSPVVPGVRAEDGFAAVAGAVFEHVHQVLRGKPQQRVRLQVVAGGRASGLWQALAALLRTAERENPLF